MVPYSYYGKLVSAVTLDTYDLNFGVPPSRETSAAGNSLRAIFLVYFTKDKNAWLGLFILFFYLKKQKQKKPGLIFFLKEESLSWNITLSSLPVQSVALTLLTLHFHLEPPLSREVK